MPNCWRRFLQIEQPDVDAVQQDLAALNVVEAQQQGDQRGFTSASVADDCEGLSGFHAERDIAQDPVFVIRFGNVAVS